MDRENIPDDVKRFILVGIHSIPYLEAMLLLRGERDRAWDAKQVARWLYQSEKAANELLLELCAAGVLRASEHEPISYRYHPVSEQLSHMIDRLADVYAKNLIEVTKLVHSKTGKKAQRFADAFIWRKDS